MKKLLMLSSILAVLSIGTPAHADDDECFVPMSKWQSRDAVYSLAQSQGWNVRRIKIDDGCYEIKGFDTSGREIEVKIDPATLEIVEFEYEDDDDHDDDDDDDNNRRINSNAASPSGTIVPTNPPNNGLFSSGDTPVVISQ